MEEELLKTRKGLKYLLRTFPSDMAVQTAISEYNNAQAKKIKQYDLKWLEHGQRHSYGDSHYTCEIHTEDIMTDNEILFITDEKGRLPYEEWKKRIGNMSDYFKGYYTIEKTSYGYLYKGVYPYDD